MQMTLADGRTQTTEILTTSVDISIQGKVIPTELLILKNARGGEPTPFIEHRINTRNHLPVAVPPYRMNPSKKEILKQEIDRLLSEGIIEECESPVCFPSGTYTKTKWNISLPRIDYRKLNEITVADTYPFLEWMTCYPSSKTHSSLCLHLICEQGYHQVKVHVEDQDKTAFVCPLALTVKLRMSYAPLGKEAYYEKLHRHHKKKMFQARRLQQQQFPAEPSIPQQELLLQTANTMSPRDVAGSREIVTPRSLNSSSYEQ
ncbi:transposon Ty3-I Gag-Pol polyprotein [Trichonephila clavipes]|nr:transposon Ty3-I Gag-Pol polyprotein [Trichonephila clavipes]